MVTPGYILFNINDKSDTLINKINCSTKYIGNITCNWTENQNFFPKDWHKITKTIKIQINLELNYDSLL